MNKRSIRLKGAFFLILIFHIPFLVGGQGIVTAERFFNSVSEHYGTIEDYEARITITHSEGVMEGVIYYHIPNLMRINFSEPKEQVIAVDGEIMSLYLPQQNVVLRQRLKQHNEAALATMASQQGLTLLKRGYSIAFLDGPNLIPLDEGSDEMVRKLNLNWRSTDEGFRQIIVSVDEDLLIRRMKAITADYETFQFEFNGIRTNIGIPEARFEYDDPASAYVIENFLFEPEE